MFRPDRLSASAVAAREPGFANPSLAPVFCLSIDVLPDPGAMARVFEQFAKRGLVPTRWHSDIIESDAMQIDIQVVGLSETIGQDIARGLRSIVGVHSVLTTRKAAQARA